MSSEPTWKRYLTDYNEGLGLVYERFVLNDFLLYLKGQHGFQTVLLSDAVSSFAPDLHAATLKNFAMKFGRVMDSAALLREIG